MSVLSTRKARTLQLGESRQSIFRSGFNSATQSGDLIWTPTGAYTGFLTAAVVMEAVSGSGNDTAAGSGARTIRIEGLDENWDFATEDITMAGASASSDTTTKFIRVFRAYVLTAGSGGVNAGVITIRGGSGSPNVASIAASRGESQMALFTTPRYYQAFITKAFARATLGSGSSSSSNIALVYRSRADLTTSPLRTITEVDSIDAQGYLVDLDDTVRVGEKTDIYWLGTADADTGDPVTANFWLDLVRLKRGSKISD